MVGKWHCGDQDGFLPVNHGFEHYFGLPYSNDMGRQTNHPDGITVPPPLPLLLDGEVIEQQPDQSSLTERYVQEAVQFMRASRDDPFFLYLAHMYVHVPIYVTEERLEQSDNGVYGAAVESIDWATKVIMRELAQLGLDENTIVIFTSDNGSLAEKPIYGTNVPTGGSNLPLRGTKTTTWEGGQRVPAIVRWKGTITPQQVNDTLLTSMDLYPTLAAFCGAHLPTDRVIDGKDVSDIWLGASTESPHETFVYYAGNSLEAIRDAQWKLHFAKGRHEVFELYDLIRDVSESHNVYEHNPDVVARLTAQANEWRRELGDARLSIEGSGIRPIGRVETPKPLTVFDPSYPYVVAEYDLDHKG
jgi:arylsulfatase A